MNESFEKKISQQAELESSSNPDESIFEDNVSKFVELYNTFTQGYDIHNTDKINFVRNYKFKRDKNSIYDVLIFIKSKLAFIFSENLTDHSKFWAAIWITKAKEVYQSGNQYIQEDSKILDLYQSILEDEKTLKRIQRRKKLPKLILPCIFVICFILFFLYQMGKPDFSMPDSYLANLLPEPITYKGEIYYNIDEEFSFKMQPVNDNEFSEYVTNLKESGFIVDTRLTDYSFDAYNHHGDKVELSYAIYSNELYVTVIKSLDTIDINWANQVGNKIPYPSTNKAHIQYNNPSSFCIYVANTDQQAFNDYVDQAIEFGYSIDYNRSNDYFYGDNSNGATLDIEYEGFDWMIIRWNEPYED